eukprot:TRINITY_DN5935_c1_g2_i1.p1 TRINITY_DN5935_c1_g2~~TRINITY_DN5935_c1_g2_i1.p1  ORF type:complete len:159 (+),score=30.12 TRINITY_DN5935_c1_g2_i1:76-552(+)
MTRKTKGVFLDFDSKEESEKKKKQKIIEMVGDEGKDDEEKKTEAVKASAKEFIEMMRSAPAPECIEDPQKDDEKEEIEISLAMDDLKEVSALATSAKPSTKSGLLLPTGATSQWESEVQLKQASAMTNLLLSLFEKDSEAGSLEDSSSASTRENDDDL